MSSTSDPAGEWITISEVSAVGSSTPSGGSGLFRGQVELSSSPATLGTNNDGVWVQTGDPVIVVYYDSNGEIVDSDAVVVVAP